LSRFNRADSLNLAAVALIVLAAAVLRFADLPSRGLIYWDEGKFLLEGVRLETALRILAGAHSSLPAGKAIGTAKPTHALLIALSFALFGVHDYSALFLSAFAGVVAIVLTYRIAGLLFDPTVGAVAALVLAVSEYDVIYSRSALSESDANALLLLGVLLWLYERCRFTSGRRHVVLLATAGMVFGLAFTTNYRILVYVAVIVGFDLLLGFRRRGLSPTVVRAGQWIAGCAVAPCVWQVIDAIARSRGTVLFRSEITHQATSYFGEVLYQIHGGKQAEVVFGPLPYLQWYVAYQGWILTMLLVLGLALAMRVRSFAWLAVFFPVVVPYLLYIWAPVIVPRNLAAAVPFTAVLIAAALVWVVRRLATGHLLVPVLLVVVLVLGVDGAVSSWRLSAERSGITLAARYVMSHGDGSVLTTSEIPAFYLRGSNGRCHTAPLPHSLARLSADVGAGYRFAIMDHNSWPAARFIHFHLRRVARYQATRTTAIGENLIAAENTHPPHGAYPIPYVDVFQLASTGLPSPGGQKAQVCDLNVL
jgi:4-amino-4-deoxy-L-arabinose transferase-like glycosyltransferase